LLDGLGVGDGVADFGNGFTLSGEESLVNSERAGGDGEETSVGWDTVAD